MRPLTLWRTTVGKKLVMAVTGVAMLVFVVLHIAGNLLVFAGATKLDAYSAFLKQQVVILWAARLILVVVVVTHVTAAYQLANRDHAARRTAYARLDPQAATIASRSMRVGGIVIAAFVIFHLLHLSTGTLRPAPFAATQVYANVVGGFQIWWVCAVYFAGIAALGLHLYHGAWSWSRTLGLSRPSATPLARPIATVVAVGLWASFTAIPLAIVVGLVR